MWRPGGFFKFYQILFLYVFPLSFYFSGLFERHKLLFSFQMTIKIMQSENKLNQDELDFFIKGNIALEKSSRRKPFPWLLDQGWEDVVKLSSVAPDVFASLCDDIERNESVWKEVSFNSVSFFRVFNILQILPALQTKFSKVE